MPAREEVARSFVTGNEIERTLPFTNFHEHIKTYVALVIQPREPHGPQGWEVNVDKYAEWRGIEGKSERRGPPKQSSIRPSTLENGDERVDEHRAGSSPSTTGRSRRNKTSNQRTAEQGLPWPRHRRPVPVHEPSREPTHEPACEPALKPAPKPALKPALEPRHVSSRDSRHERGGQAMHPPRCILREAYFSAKLPERKPWPLLVPSPPSVNEGSRFIRSAVRGPKTLARGDEQRARRQPMRVPSPHTAGPWTHSTGFHPAFFGP
jgi:hypothetical protein